MFDFGFSELIVIAVVALIVVGPERLPKVARTAGHLLGRLQRYVNDVKSDIQREMQLEDLKKLQQQVEQQARELESSMRSEAQSVEADLEKTVAEAKSGLSGDTAAVPETTPTPVTEAPPPPVVVTVLGADAAAADGAAVEPQVDSRQLELGLGPASAGPASAPAAAPTPDKATDKA
ncbi:Sec-independent protein translocase protein TatB [Azoarcus sp. DN11]|uniref:Sec-independent protein translocase protein TatB n=1 Tax=Azoarcus sp. DN11 TaxID=356837 RepID=UPI000EB45093|nr:Sec-independent protein translocase protein TatB [Azoarcus sp. DN11]AYH42619.1 twin-arginine translocase subunit TatB [Azoarcus sp. DN11]